LNTVYVCYNQEGIFAEKRFRFLIEWDPTFLLLQLLDENRGYLPLHRATHFCSIQGFKSVFETGIRYYPIKKGINILFKKDNDGDTPFQYACKRFEYEQVMNVIIEDALVRSFFFG
jgi:ankyrin repeat protein